MLSRLKGDGLEPHLLREHHLREVATNHRAAGKRTCDAADGALKVVKESVHRPPRAYLARLGPKACDGGEGASHRNDGDTLRSAGVRHASSSPCRLPAGRHDNVRRAG